MNKYLETLSKIKANEWCNGWLPQIERIEQYAKGEITSQELMKDADDTMKGIIYHTINKIINYEEKEVRYYIELPKDMFFTTMGSKCILAGSVEEIDIIDNIMKTIGPKHQAKGWLSFSDNHYIEITGNFSQFPNGVMLYNSDWNRIISKYPNLVQRMYNLTVNDYEFGNKYKNITMEQVKKNITEHLAHYVNAPQDGEPNHNWSGKNEAQYLPQEVIDSIKFVIPVEHLSKMQVLSGNFGTFEEILNGKSLKEPVVTNYPPQESVQTTHTR